MRASERVCAGHWLRGGERGAGTRDAVVVAGLKEMGESTIEQGLSSFGLFGAACHCWWWCT